MDFKFLDETDRLWSFGSKWTHNTQIIEPLVKAGFVYTGDDDTVLCVSCGFGLKNFKKNITNPMYYHIKYSYKCNALCKLMGCKKEELEKEKKKYKNYDEEDNCNNDNVKLVPIGTYSIINVYTDIIDETEKVIFIKSENIKRKNYSSFKKRYSSFLKCDKFKEHIHDNEIKECANSGFYHNKEFNYVECFVCGLVAVDEFNKDPRIIHALFNRDCEYYIKGKDDISKSILNDRCEIIKEFEKNPDIDIVNTFNKLCDSSLLKINTIKFCDQFKNSKFGDIFPIEDILFAAIKIIISGIKIYNYKTFDIDMEPREIISYIVNDIWRKKLTKNEKDSDIDSD